MPVMWTHWGNNPASTEPRDIGDGVHFPISPHPSSLVQQGTDDREWKMFREASHDAVCRSLQRYI